MNKFSKHKLNKRTKNKKKYIYSVGLFTGHNVALKR